MRSGYDGMTAEQVAEHRDKVRVAKAGRLHAEKHVHIPTPADPGRRLECGADLAVFLRHYFPDEFSLPFSADQLEQLRAMQEVIAAGGRLAVAAPRGDGKTTRIIRAALWAMLYGHRRFLVPVAADEEKAGQILATVKAELSQNERLIADFPEVCVPLREAALRPKIADALHYQGEPFRMLWKAHMLVLPAVERIDGWPVGVPLAALGQVIWPRGILSSMRGMQYNSKGGNTIRPDLVFLDDPQTDESARSLLQCDEREKVISGTIMGLAGPRRRIAAFAAVTIIKRRDVADRLLDKKLHPEWGGKIYRLVQRWPEAQETLWREYAETWREHGADAARELYAGNREAMDAGAVVGWEHRVRDGELSAIHTAQNLRLEFGDLFAAEYQNEPKAQAGGRYDLTPEIVARNLTGLPRGHCPEDTALVSIGCDVNPTKGLNWVACAWTHTGACCVIDWGKYPEHDRPLWKSGDRLTEEQATFQGIQAWLDDVLSGARFRNAKTAEPVIPAVVAIDVGYKRDVVVSAIKAARMRFSASQLVPIRGQAARHHAPRKGQRKGAGWYVAEWAAVGRVLAANVDEWRERMQRAFLLPPMAPGAAANYGTDPARHKRLAQNVAAEKLVDILTGERGITSYVWSIQPGDANDLMDALVYAGVAGCYCGSTFAAADRSSVRPRGWLVSPAVDPLPAQAREAKPATPAADTKRPAEPIRALLRPGGGFVKNW